VDLALQFRTQEGEKLVKAKFLALLEDRQTELAAKIARAAPKNLVRRDKDVFRLLFRSDANQIFDFYSTVVLTQKLDSKESHLLGRSLLELNRAEELQKLFKDDKVTYSDPLGDEILKHDPVMAESLEKEHQQADYTIKEAIKLLGKTDEPNKNILFFLSSVMHQTEDTLIHFAYLEGCIKSGNNAEVVRIIKERPFYDAEKVRNLIATSFLADPAPMITLCHKHDYIEFLSEYLFKNNQIPALFAYAAEADSHKNLPRLLSALLDLK